MSFSEWNSVKLGDLIKINEKSISKNSSFDEILYYDTSSITENKFDEPLRIALIEAPSRAKRIVKNNDIVYSTVRPIQKHFGIFKNVKPNTIVSTGFAVISAKDIDSTFLYYYLSQNSIVEFLNAVAESSTTTFPAFNPSLLETLDITLPSNEIQSRIASILSSLDDKIELNRQTNQTLEAIAQALFKEWFVEFNFPGFDGKLIEGLPKGWKVKKLSEVATLIAGGDKPKDVSDTANDILNIPIFSNGISNEGLYGYTNSARIKEESVTVSARGTIGFVCLRLEPYLPIVRLISVIPNQNFMSAKFLFMWLKNQNIQGYGTTQQQLTVPDFSRYEILIPDNSTMINFTRTLNSFFNKIHENKKQIQTITTLRDSLLPKLMKGEVEI